MSVKQFCLDLYRYHRENNTEKRNYTRKDFYTLVTGKYRNYDIETLRMLGINIDRWRY